MAPSTALCVCCNKLYDQTLMAQCSICKKLYKNTCINLSGSEIRSINSKKGVEWSCEDCREFGNDLMSLKAIIIELKNDIQQLKDEKITRSNDFDIEDVIAEINERNKRKCNLVFFGLKEQDQGQPVELRTANEKSSVENILRTIAPSINAVNIKPTRLGHYNEAKCRPIKISLPTEDQVHLAIRSAKNLRKHQIYKNISISFDRTPQQIQYYAKIKNNLAERLNSGENNLKIKYVNGVPKIMSEN